MEKVSSPRQLVSIWLALYFRCSSPVFLSLTFIGFVSPLVHVVSNGDTLPPDLVFNYERQECDESFDDDYDHNDDWTYLYIRQPYNRWVTVTQPHMDIKQNKLWIIDDAITTFCQFCICAALWTPGSVHCQIGWCFFNDGKGKWWDTCHWSRKGSIR